MDGREGNDDCTLTRPAVNVETAVKRRHPFLHTEQPHASPTIRRVKTAPIVLYRQGNVIEGEGEMQHGRIRHAVTGHIRQRLLRHAKQRLFQRQGQRLRPDGTPVQWLFGMPERFVYPFLCADVTARELRVPPGAARDHANGAAGITELTVAVQDLEKCARAFEVIVEGFAAPGDTPQERRLWLEQWAIRLVSLETVGAVNEGLCAVRFAGWDGALPPL